MNTFRWSSVVQAGLLDGTAFDCIIEVLPKNIKRG